MKQFITIEELDTSILYALELASKHETMFSRRLLR
jgi:hypothetical protein